MSRPRPAFLALLGLAFACLALSGVGRVPAAQPAAPAPSPDVESRLQRAEALHAEGSYGLAHDLLRELEGEPLPPDLARRVTFLEADSLWRSHAGDPSPDASDLDRARKTLETLGAEAVRVEERDEWWADVQESLGDFHWTRRDSRNQGAAWPHYERALEWWAGSSEIDRARERYLAIVWKAARPPRAEPWYVYGIYGSTLPLPVLENASRIAVEPDDRAHAAWLLAMTLRGSAWEPRAHRRVIEAFEAALAAGPATDWYDDALFQFAEWLAQAGRIERVEGGGWQRMADYPRALGLYRRLLDEFDEGESRHRDDAARRIEAITGPSLDLAVGNVFLPGSEAAIHLSWRNVKEIDFSLHPVELTGDLDFGPDDTPWDPIAALDPGRRPSLRTWTRATGDRGDHEPGRETIFLEPRLEPGAYLLRARGQGESSSVLVLVTRAALVVKSTDDRALVWAVDAVDGSPLAGAELSLWIAPNDRGGRQRLTAKTDEDGLAEFDLPRFERSGWLFVAAASEAGQAITSSGSVHSRSATDGWRVYTFAERPALRPGEKVGWKVIARRRTEEGYATRVGGLLGYRVTDPRGAEVAQGTLTLNEFGGAWDELALDGSAVLGEYRIVFRDGASSGAPTIGSATLFRVEEYKLPEYTVSVTTPESDGAPKSFVAGDAVEAEVLAEYYFGGPVAGAEVEVLVRQRPFRIGWTRPRDYPWLYDEGPGRDPYGWRGPGQIVQREKLRTDERGRATVVIDTAAAVGQDLEYTIEARVTDASRREVSGSGSVRVGRQRHWAFVDTEHNLYRPGDDVKATVRAVDANERPVEVEGTLTVTRDRWVEVWIDPRGREVFGDALRKVRSASPSFPPPPGPGERPWVKRFEGYERDVVLERTLRTSEAGEAAVVFTLQHEGYYRLAWRGEDSDGLPVDAESVLWVADRTTTGLGSRHGGLELIVDRDTFRAGGKAHAMLAVPFSGARVLFTVESDEIHERRLVRLAGNVKLLAIDLDDRHVPNVFLTATLVRDGELLRSVEQVVVPPVEHYLEVEVEPDREEYLPGGEGRLRVTTRDADGRPVAAEVALALVDEAVFAIQPDYAGDPRPFFFGSKRALRVRTWSSFDRWRLARLEKNRDGEVIDALRHEPVSEAQAALGDVRFKKDAEMAPPSGPLIAGVAAPARGSANSIEEMEVARFEADEMKQQVGGGEGDVIAVRTDFRATALWRPGVVTDADGTAEVTVRMPESLTSWRATARAATAGSAFGFATSATRTGKPLMARLQSPRFFVVGDRAVVSAQIDSRADRPIEVEVALEVDGLELSESAEVERITVPAGGQVRVEWNVEAREAGTATLRVSARGDGRSDAMERSLRVYEHGIEKLVWAAGKLRGDEAIVTLDLPRERRPGSTSVEVQVTPSIAMTMLDALPYLVRYPYGCTEQTMSRFLPAVITARALERLGLARGDVTGRVFGGIEREHAEATHDDEAPGLDRLDDVTRAGLARLYDFQHGDGGWGWWKEGDSDPFMTAYVVWGLGLAREAGVDVRSRAIERGVDFLEKQLVEYEEDGDLQAWMLHAAVASRRGGESAEARRAFDNLWGRRDGLDAAGRALLTSTAVRLGAEERAREGIGQSLRGRHRRRSLRGYAVRGFAGDRPLRRRHRSGHCTG